MLLGEPPPSPADVHFKLFGFPVRIHPFFWLITILFGIRSETAQQLIAWVIAVCIGVVVHELGHAFAWRIHGQHPWITLYGLGGLTSVRSADYGRRGGGSFAQIFISFAGPLAGFALAGLVIAVAYAAGTPIKWIHILSKVPFPVIGLQSEAAFFIVTDLLFVCYFWGNYQSLARLSARRRANCARTFSVVASARGNSLFIDAFGSRGRRSRRFCVCFSIENSISRSCSATLHTRVTLR